MIATYATVLIILAASLLLGRAILTALGVRHPTHLSAVTGFATLVTISPFVIRLPGRATTAAIVLLIALAAAIITVVRSTPRWRSTTTWVVPLVTTIVMIAAASLPFVANERFGVLGEGIYTNDHAAQLYWTDWLQNGFGPEPNAVQFGYPVGPQALAAIAAEATGADLVEALNGLLLAIPALTALTALAVLGGLPPGRRVLVASLAALPYLAASFLAQSAFKETAMALLLVGFAVALRELGRGEVPRRATLAILALIAVASVFTFSVPGLAWFAVAIAVWLALELIAGRRPVALGAVRAAIGGHRLLTAGAVAIAVAVLALAAAPTVAFFDRIADVQFSAGRLGSPVFPGEALGVWPAGDFRLVRGDVEGAIPAVLLGFAALCVGVWALVRRGELALLAALAAAAAVYAGARLVAEIHVEAKALAVMAPLIALVSLRALLAPAGPGESRPLAFGRVALGVLFAAAAAASALGALRDAPVGFDDRAVALERLGERIEGSSVAFLGVDRFSAYRLRGTEIESPGGFVPPRVNARSRKLWRQGRALDLDTLAPRKLDRFDYAITTTAAYQSTPTANMRLVATEGDYALWERTGPTPQNRVIGGEDGRPGAVLGCDRRRLDRVDPGTEATVLERPVAGGPADWSGAGRVDPRDAAAGQEDAFVAPATATQILDLAPGSWLLSLQYHSQVPLVVEAPGMRVELPPSLDGMYLDGAGRGAFWPAGEVEVSGSAGREPVSITVTAAEPGGLQRALGVERRFWLGDVAASPASEPRTVPIEEACSRYVDRVLPPD